MAGLLFKLEYTILELMVASEIVLTFEYGGPHALKVVVRAPSGEERLQGHSASHAFCTASSAVEPNEKVRDIFAKIAANVIILPDDDSTKVCTEYSAPDGSRIRLPALSGFPECFRSFMENVSRELHDWSVRTVSVLRWRAHQIGPHYPITTRGLHWSVDGAFWHPAPATFAGRVRTLGTMRISERLRAEVENMVRVGDGAPLHHDLFREAWQQYYENPRSALVIGMAAAELSVKQCISTLVPDAQWLATNLPTPPLRRMLREYLPKLPARCKLDGQVKPPPTEVLDTLEKGVTIRNQLSHAGTASPSVEVVEEILRAVQDLLWLMDYYSGAEWALNYLSPDSRAKLSAS